MHSDHLTPTTGTFLVKRHTRTFPVQAVVIARAQRGKWFKIQYFDDEGHIRRRVLRSVAERARFTPDTQEEGSSHHG